jgi:hypothetical protein
MHRIAPGGGLQLVKDSGAYWVRKNALLWSEVEPQEGARNWEAIANLEAELKNAADSGLQTILIVRSTPAWAQKLPGVSCGQILPEKMGAFGAFLHDVVSRYSQPPYNVRYWELGNEPDVDPAFVDANSIFGCWGDQTDPEGYGGGVYAEMLKVAYPQIKAVDPQAQVLIGGLLLDCDPDIPRST